jgi:hypothetical protein
MSPRWPAWASIDRHELIRIGLLLPREGEQVPRRILRVPRPDVIPPPPRPTCWSGECGRDLTVPVFSATGHRLMCYCHRADAWTSSARTCYG